MMTRARSDRDAPSPATGIIAPLWSALPCLLEHHHRIADGVDDDREVAEPREEDSGQIRATQRHSSAEARVPRTARGTGDRKLVQRRRPELPRVRRDADTRQRIHTEA